MGVGWRRGRVGVMKACMVVVVVGFVAIGWHQWILGFDVLCLYVCCLSWIQAVVEGRETLRKYDTVVEIRVELWRAIVLQYIVWCQRC